MIKNLKWLLLVSLTVVACNSDDAVQVEASSDGLPLTSGLLIFKICCIRKFIASGYSDNALFIEVKKCLHEYYGATICRWRFKIPFMSDNIGGLKLEELLYLGPLAFLTVVGQQLLQNSFN
jgi:hypothetical protein